MASEGDKGAQRAVGDVKEINSAGLDWRCGGSLLGWLGHVGTIVTCKNKEEMVRGARMNVSEFSLYLKKPIN